MASYYNYNRKKLDVWLDSHPRDVQELLVRESAECTGEEFCERLYEVLWSKPEGWTNTALIVHELYQRTKICAITIAAQCKYRCFEEMLHSKDLAHVVDIQSEKLPEYEQDHYVGYTYTATMTDQYKHLRRGNRRRPKLDCFGIQTGANSSRPEDSAKEQDQVAAKMEQLTVKPEEVGESSQMAKLKEEDGGESCKPADGDAPKKKKNKKKAKGKKEEDNSEGKEEEENNAEGESNGKKKAKGKKKKKSKKQPQEDSNSNKDGECHSGTIIDV